MAHNSSVILQIYANIIKKPIKVSRSKHASAFGMAIFSSVAAGKENGGYDNMFEATAKMGVHRKYVITLRKSISNCMIRFIRNIKNYMIILLIQILTFFR